MRVIGIDPGTLNAGFGIVEEKNGGLVKVASGCISVRGKDVAQRLVGIYKGLKEAITVHKPQEAAVETVFAGNNIKTAIAIGEGRGVALLAAAEAGLPVVGYEPSVVKRSVTSSGRAGKEQVQQMVKILLGLPEMPETDHEADALAMAITHIRRREVENMTGKLPARNSRGSYRRRR